MTCIVLPFALTIGAEPMVKMLKVQQGVGVPTIGIDERSIVSLMHKKALKSSGYRPVSRQLSIATNMERQAEINRILDHVHSLDDLSADDVTELRSISECSLVIDKLKVSPAEYQDWSNKVGDDIRGVEYDAQSARIILKGCPGWMHEAATSLIIKRLLGDLEDRLSDASGSMYSLTGSMDCSLADEFGGSTIHADASISKNRSKWPAVVLEVGVSEKTNKLYEDARRWLEGSDGNTKLVIIVDVDEDDRRKALNDKWDLSETDFQETSHNELSDKIFQWYQEKGIRLVGKFKLSVHLWYSDGDRKCILKKAAFSPDNLFDITTIEDVPLRLAYLLPAGSDTSPGLYFPLKHLVEKLQSGFEDVEISRASGLAKAKQKEYLKS